ncbi:MAG: sulfur carrier protein ThiS adenylyltransferase ThiF [Desulfovibrio sp.]|nr:sulfur carrier protein ThiS adenylyltransferase ThiF [Desulfovibrio sp.]
MDETLHQGLLRYLDAASLNKLSQCRVGIAGLGGLGSNTAMLLARTGFEHFVLADYDSVEASNLNRQNYLPEDLGARKTLATLRHLRAINSQINAYCFEERITKTNLPELLRHAQIWVEALDVPESKALFVQTALLAGKNVASASGIAGFGGTCLERRTLHKLVLVGDFVSDVTQAPPLAPRVMWAAAMLADAVLDMVLQETKKGV